MWSPSDNKKKDDVDECRCSSGSAGGSSSSNISEQQQQLNLFENNSKKPTASFTSNLTTDDTTATFHKEQELAGAHAHATESGDSGFISGPQTSSFHEEQPSGEAEKKGASSASAQSYNIDPSDRHHRAKELDEKFVIDSGCIDEEEDDFDEADNGDEAIVGGERQQQHEVKRTLVVQSQTQQRHQQHKQQNATTVASNTNTAAERAELPTSAQPTDQMILKHDVDAGMSERFCSLSLQSGANINNLNAGAAAAPTAAATTATATNIPPWEQYYQQNDDGDTYLHLACISGHDNVVAALIRLAPHPCLLNIQNDDGQTALHLAALTTQRRILRMLLLAGAEPTIRDCRGNTALHLACISGDEQCVSALTIPFSASEINEAHRQYGYRSNDKTVSSLSYASLPSDLEMRNYKGERCVHLAAQAGHIKILGILVQHGADINAREGRSGRTPLHISIENCNEELANFLLDDCKQKLDLETATFAGLTAYQIACILNKSQMQSILENRGAEPLTPPDSDYDSSDIETDLDDAKIYDRFGDPGYFASYKGGNPMTVA